MTFTIEVEPEDNGRRIAEVDALPGVMCYGPDLDEAVVRCRRWHYASLPTVWSTASCVKRVWQWPSRWREMSMGTSSRSRWSACPTLGQEFSDRGHQFDRHFHRSVSRGRKRCFVFRNRLFA